MTDPTSKELNLQAPLAAFKGEKPEAPRWFEQAIARTPQRSFTEVDGVSFTLKRGETLGLVGERCCGNRTTGRAGGCFHTRCPEVMDICKTQDPALVTMGAHRAVACRLLVQPVSMLVSARAAAAA